MPAPRPLVLGPLLLGPPLLAALLLSACAPAAQPAWSPAGQTPTPSQNQNQAPAQADASNLRAAFSPDGVAWVVGGKACVARAPGYRPSCPRLPPVSDVNWFQGDAWAAVPSAGVLVTLDRAPRTLTVGATARLSARAAYREDGSALSYAGDEVGGVVGRPSDVVTGGDGQDYAVVAGILRRVSDGAPLDPAPQAYLLPTPQGATTAPWPSAETRFGRYQLTGNALEFVAAGQVVRRAPHGPGRVGVVGADVLTLSPQGVIRRFTQNLEEVPF